MRSSKQRLIISAIVALCAGVITGFVAWLIITSAQPAAKLQQYKTDAYTILVPVGYIKKEDSGNVVFTKPNTTNGQQATVAVTLLAPMPADSRQEIIDTVRGSVTKKNLENPTDKNSVRYRNVVIKNSWINGVDTTVVTGETTNASGAVARTKIGYYFGKENLYMVIVSSYTSDKALIAAMQKVIDSFTLR